ncbi:MAG: hypothetical protein B6241_15550 [Spirochaetaceae bacterium 4572_59]|nr:MAG: hypothetical protein B6241_15550 [Spirochaetaceae bacterium 4572_59]
MFKARKSLATLLFLVSLISLEAQAVYHTLKKGETLYSLSKTYNVSVQDLINSNNISAPENLSEGFRLLIPGSSVEENIQIPIKKSTIIDNSSYTVQKGDTFYRIAKTHDLSVNELMMLNDFTGNRILRPGEILLVKKSSSIENAARDQLAIDKEKTGAVLVTSSRNISWPVEGVKKTLTGKLRGVTIGAAESSLVQSIASGKVVWTGPYRGFGQVVLIDVDGYIYLYGGNEDIFVNVGEYVPSGARIGRLGNSGLASRTVNMYFSVFKDGIPVSVLSAPRG